jgi:hypothetical protein
MERKKAEFSLESINFVFRHHWVFIAAIVLVLNLVGVYMTYLKLHYQVRGMIAFETTSAGVVDSKFIQAKHSLIKDILVGSNIKAIVDLIQPGLAENDPSGFDSLVNYLRNPRTGIKIIPERGASPDSQQVNIVFTSRDPKFSYAVVAATMQAFESLSKEKTRDKIVAGGSFLKKQLGYYRAKITKIDEYVSQLKGELERFYPSLNPEERKLVDENLAMLGMTIVNPADYARKIGSREGMDEESEASVRLMRMNKRKKLIETALEEGDTGIAMLARKDADEDVDRMQYDREIAEKEAAKTQFLAKGCLPEHPYVKKMDRDIETLRDLKSERARGLTDMSKAKQRYGEELKDLNASITSLNFEKERMANNDKERAGILPGDSSKPHEFNDVSLMVARLMELKDEKDVSQHYYDELRQQFEVAELKGRMETEKSGIEIRVIEEPKLPEGPMPVNKTRVFLLGLFIALAAGFGSAYLLDLLDGSIRTSAALRAITGVLVLGAIDRIMMHDDVIFSKLKVRVAVIVVVIFTIFMQTIGTKLLIPVYMGVFGL